MSIEGNTPVDAVPEQNEEVSVPADPIVQYYVRNAEGEIVRSGECVKSLVQFQAFIAGETSHEGAAPAEEKDNRILTTHVIPRQQAYPTLAEQLDVIWKILARNPEALGEEGQEMLLRIQIVKETYPKGVTYEQNMGPIDDQSQPAFIPVTEN